MNKSVKIIGSACITALFLTAIIAGTVSASSEQAAPAPNSGDGISDGSGFVSPNGPNVDIISGGGPVGPAPNSGDGVSDGSGF